MSTLTTLWMFTLTTLSLPYNQYFFITLVINPSPFQWNYKKDRMESTWSYTNIKWICSDERSMTIEGSRTIVWLDLWRRALDEHPCAILLSSNEDRVRCCQERCRRLDSSWSSCSPCDALRKWRASKLPRRELHRLRALLHGPTATACCVLWQQIHIADCLTI